MQSTQIQITTALIQYPRILWSISLVFCCLLFNPLFAQESTRPLRSNGQTFKHKFRQPTASFSAACSRDANRSINGTCNNLRDAASMEWGAADIALVRELPAAYGAPDFFNEMGGNCRLSARAISNLVANQSGDVPSPRNLSSMVFTWGQFIDHDLDLTPEDHTEYQPILLPSNEPLFTSPIAFFRSAVYPGTGVNTAREQQNLITAWMDASQIYGSEESRAQWLRTFSQGKLKTSTGNLLPYNTVDGEKDSAIDPNAPSMAGDGSGTAKVFVAGDIRANEQPGLTSLHTLFVREHNRICDQLVQAGFQNDESNYQRARKRVGAYIQAITYEAFLPALGIQLTPYAGYQSRVRPDISNLFATAAYRLGHTMVTSEIPLVDENCNAVGNGSLSLLESFFNPSLLDDYGIEPILQGLASQTQQQVDPQIVDDLRNFLFPVAGSPDPFGLDLASLNIQRGRDHGLPDYNVVRSHYLGAPARSFADISTDPDVQTALEAAYGHVYDMDVWVGLLAEDPLAGSSVGPTLHAILAKQFEQIRDGDYYFYLNDPDFSPQQREQIGNVSLRTIIERNSPIDALQADVFFATDCGENNPGGGGNNGPGGPGRPGNGPGNGPGIGDTPVPTDGLGQGLTTYGLAVYPNPTEDLVQLDARLNNKATSASIQLHGPDGRVLQQFSVAADQGILRHQLDVHDLPSGVYWVTVQAGTELYTTKVLIR